jgi:hypothetical protein
MLKIKADGQAEMRLLEFLYPATPSTLPTHLDRERMPAAIQQQLNELTFIVQEQQRQLEQARAAIADYQQMMLLLGDQQTPLLPPAASISGQYEPRQYITGGLSQPAAITVNFQSAPATQQKRAMRMKGWPKHLTKTTLLLALFILTTWGVFRYVAPPITNWVFSLHQSSTKEKASNAQPTPTPQSNLSEEDAPGSAASKAGTQPNALDF